MTLARDPGTYTLAERHLIRTSVCFLDETGLLHKPADLYFGVGMIKGSPASDLTRLRFTLSFSRRSRGGRYPTG